MVNLNPRPSYAGNLGVKMGIRAKSTSPHWGHPSAFLELSSRKQAVRLPASLPPSRLSVSLGRLTSLNQQTENYKN